MKGCNNNNNNNSNTITFLHLTLRSKERIKSKIHYNTKKLTAPLYKN